MSCVEGSKKATISEEDDSFTKSEIIHNADFSHNDFSLGFWTYKESYSDC